MSGGGTTNTSGELDSGTCGENLTWVLYNDGELVISGTGAMDDWGDHPWQSFWVAPWCSYNSQIKKVKIGNFVTHIGDWAFEGCTNLNSIAIPDSVTSIGGVAFEGCTNLTSIAIPDSVTSIGWGSFSDTGYYNNAENWENGVLYIGDHLISASSDLAGTYTIKEGTKSIAASAFPDCTNLTSITVPDSVKHIGINAFRNCTNLASIIVDEKNMYYSSIDNALYNKNATEIIFGSQDKDGSFTIPNSVTSIGDYAFAGCYNLTSIKIPDSVTSIGDYAFLWCDNLTNVYYTGTQEQWDAIEIGFDNSYLINANITYNFMSRLVAARAMLRGAIERETTTEIIHDAVVGSDYIMLVVKDANAENLLAAENLLYIDQKTAESEQLTFAFPLDDRVEVYQVLLFVDANSTTNLPVGDVDQSGGINVADIVKLKALIMAGQWSETQLALGDLNHSNSLDVGDIMMVKNMIMSR